jgi:hypothetical protein
LLSFRPPQRAGGIAVMALLVAGFAAALWFLAPGGESSGPGPQARRDAEARPGATRPEAASPSQAAVGEALRRGVDRAAGLGGEVEAAAMADGWAAPVVVTSEGSSRSRYMRMWSMSKVATMIAVLRQLEWGAQPGRAVSAELDEAFQGAVVRSENCRQRRVVLELQHQAGGAAAARSALAEVFALSGARAQVGTPVESPDSLCLPYLEAQRGLPDPLAPALLLGTSTWRVEDAARLMQALSEESFGAAVSRRVLDLMRQPKQESREVPAGELTAPLDWGAGVVFAGLDPAYKAGWGGAPNGSFLAGQVALVRLPDGDSLALATMFHPHAQPSRDDPGITVAPAAIELVMRSLLVATAS